MTQIARPEHNLAQTALTGIATGAPAERALSPGWCVRVSAREREPCRQSRHERYRSHDREHGLESDGVSHSADRRKNNDRGEAK
jgi:hypothetical protein